MTNMVDCKKSDSVGKSRLKTASGVRTIRCRSSTLPGEAENSPELTASGFGFLPELFDCQDQFSIGEGSLLDLPPDFSTYNFWASESHRSLSHVGDISDTFSHCDSDRTLEYAPSLEPVLDAPGPDDIPIFANKDGLVSQNSMYSSGMKEEIANEIPNRRSYWYSPLALEEDIFECIVNWNLLKEVNEKDFDGEKIVADYLVDGSPRSSNDVTNIENVDSTVLVYAPNRYLEDACIFQSSRADLEPDKPRVETLSTVDGNRIRYSPEGSFRKRCRLQENWMDDGQAMNTDFQKSVTSSSMEVSTVENLTAKKPVSETEEKAHLLLRMQHCFNHRRRRFSAPGMKRSKFLESTCMASGDKRSPKQDDSDIKPDHQGRSPIRNSDTAYRALKPEYCSNSSAGDSDQNNDKSPSRPPPGQLVVPFKCETKYVSQETPAISYRGSASPLKDETNQSSNGRTPTFKSTSSPRLLRKKRSRYIGTRDGPETRKIVTRLDREGQSHDSPKNSKFNKASPRNSPPAAQFRRSPWDSRKKVRTFRRRSQGSPLSAKKLHFYGKIIYGRSGQVVHGTPSPEKLDVFLSGTKSNTARGRRRVPLPQSSVEILQEWLHENLPDPYPSRQEKEDLLFQTGLKMSQIDNWLGNARQKLKLKSRAVKDICSESSSSLELPRKRSKRKRSYPLKMQI